jgi:hypothetical protein
MCRDRRISSTISGVWSLAACTAKEEEDEGTNASCAARDVVSWTSTPATDPDDVDESWGLNGSCLWWCLRSILGNIGNIIRRHRVPQSVLTAVLPIDPILMGFPIKRPFCNAPFALCATLSSSNYTRTARALVLVRLVRCHVGPEEGASIESALVRCVEFENGRERMSE